MWDFTGKAWSMRMNRHMIIVDLKCDLEYPHCAYAIGELWFLWVHVFFFQVCVRLCCLWGGLVMFFWIWFVDSCRPCFSALLQALPLAVVPLLLIKGRWREKPTWCSERPKQLVLYRRRTHVVNPNDKQISWSNLRLRPNGINSSNGHGDPVPQWLISLAVFSFGV